MISHSFWEREFGSDPGAMGRKLRLNGADFTVIGVAPKGFLGPEAYVVSDVYVPMHAYPQALPNSDGQFLTARGNRELSLVATPEAGSPPPRRTPSFRPSPSTSHNSIRTATAAGQLLF